MRKEKGKFIISLDFELNWGVRDVIPLEEYRNNLDGVRIVVPSLLKLFNAYNIHTTWATVGFLFFGSKKELLAGIPAQQPAYLDQNLSPYPTLASIGNNEQEDPYHFAASLVALIKEYPGQEIATHTFCHYYCLEPGQTAETFRQDLLAARAAAEKYGVELKSLVFPRNQFNKEYLEICKELGIRSYRGNEAAWMYRESSSKNQTSARRAARLADTYFNISGRNCYSMAEMKASFPYNIPASRFLRPYSPKLKALEKLRLHRITADMTYAAQNGLTYHLWWHPHNFGVNIDQNLAFLTAILKHFQFLQQTYGMESVTMAELSEQLNDYHA